MKRIAKYIGAIYIIFIIFIPSVSFSVTLFSENFEGAWPNTWYVGNDGGVSGYVWGDNNYRAYAGSWSGFCADNGNNSASTYPNNLHTYMEKRGVSLAGYSSATLTFRYYIHSETTFDYFTVNVRDQSGSWHELFRDSGNKSSSGWIYKSISLNSFLGQSGLYIQFRFDSDNSVTIYGVWLDEIYLNATAASSPDLSDRGESYRYFSPTTIVSGQNFTVGTDVQNSGGTNAGSFTVEFYASPNTTISIGDYLLCSANITGVNAGSYANADCTTSFPSSVPPGTYYVGWIIDANDSVSESNESNNIAYKTGYQLTVNATPADLFDRGESYRYFSPTSIMAGQNFTVGTDIQNSGGSHAYDFKIDFYASTNTTISTADYLLCSVNIGVAAGSWENADCAASFPSSVPPGTYYVGWIIDADNQISESNESNNKTYKAGYQLTVNPTLPDLIDRGETYRSFSPQTIATSQSFSIYTDIRNSGLANSGSFNVAFYASTNTTISTSDYLIGAKNCGPINAGAWLDCDWSGSFPSSIPAGTYYVGWIIDSNNVIAESNESNNTAYKTGYQLTVTQGFWVKGQVKYTNRTYDTSGFTGTENLPIRYAAVQIRESESLTDYTIGTTNTDSTGYFEYYVPDNNDGVGGNRDIYVRVIADSSAAVVQSNLTFLNYYFDSPIATNWPGGELWMDDNPYDAIHNSYKPSYATNYNANAAFNILDTMINGYQWADGLDGTATPPKVTCEWDYQHSPSCGTCFNGLNTINILGSDNDPDEYDDDILLHEYGHFIAAKYSYDKSPGNTHYWEANFNYYYSTRPEEDGGPLTLLQSRQLVWSEGWAHFVSSAVRNDYKQVDIKDSHGGSGFTYGYLNLETAEPAPYEFGPDNEATIAAALWDIFDSDAESFDSLFRGDDEIFTIVDDSSYFNSSVDCDIDDFWNGWFGSPNYGNQSEMCSIFTNFNINYSVCSIDLFDDGEAYRSFSPTTVYANQSFNISMDIRNGGGLSSGSFTVAFYASTNTTISASDYLIGTKTCGPINAGDWVDCDWSGSFPSSIPIGTYWVGWIIDSTGVVSESNETNNTAYKQGYQLGVVSPPIISRSPSSMSFSAQTGQSAGSQTLSISNSGGGTLSYSLSESYSWLSVSPTSGTATTETDSITVTASCAGMSAGTYNGSITISAPGATNTPQATSVSLTCTAPPTISRSPSSMNFSAQAGQSAGSQTLSISNSGGGTLSYTLSESYGWLSLSPTSGTATTETDSITVSATCAGMSEGTYIGTIQIDAPGATNTPQSASVDLACEPPPAISVSPSGTLDYDSVSVGDYLDKTFTVTNSGGGILNGTASVSSPYSVISGASYSLSAGQSQVVTIRFSPTSAGPSSQTVTFTGAAGATRTVTGTGVPSSQIAVTPESTTDFGSVAVGKYADRAFTVSNTGGGVLTGTASVSAPFSIVSGGNYSLSNGQNQTVTVRFEPASEGDFNQAVNFTGGGGATRMVTGHGYYVPAIVLSADTVDFGIVTIGGYAEHELTISNTGQANLTASAIISGTDFFLECPADPMTIIPNGSARCTVIFEPTAEVVRTGTITVTSNDPDYPTLEVDLVGEGEINPVANIQVEPPDSIEFGEVTIGQVATRVLTISNIGDADLVVGATINGLNYSIDCPGDPMTIIPGGAVICTVNFYPDQEAYFTNQVTITSNDPDSPTIIISLGGIGIPESVADINVFPSSIDFGSVTIGQIVSRSLTISNIGDANLTASASITGTDFQLTCPVNPMTILPYGSIQCTVKFAPSSETFRSGVITIDSNDPDEPTVTVSLTGTGYSLSVPDIRLSSSALNFGLVTLGQTSSKVFKIFNDGNAQLDVTLNVFGTDFLIDCPANPASILPGENLQCFADFNPQAEGLQTGVITIDSNDPDSPYLEMSLSGTGTSLNVPDIEVSDVSLNFGSVTVGEDASKTLTVLNVGTADLAVDVTITPGDFSMVCDINPATIISGDSISCDVTFTPGDASYKTGVITITSDDPDESVYYVSLSGTGEPSDGPGPGPGPGGNGGGGGGGGGCGCMIYGGTPSMLHVAINGLIVLLPLLLGLGARMKRRIK